MDDLNANPAGAGGDADPVSMIESILDRERQPASPPRKAADQKPAPEPEAEPAEPETEREQAPPAEEEGGEDAEGAEKQEEQQEPEQELFTVKAGGQEIQVNRDELVRGYQRLSDYHRNIQQVAEQRKAVEAETQRIAAEREHYAQQLDQFAQILSATLPQEPDWTRLSQEDPIGYVQTRAQWDERVRQLQGLAAERQRIAQEQTQQQRVRLQQHLRSEQERLLDRVPEWRDAKRAEAEQRDIHRTLKDAGFSDQEIGTVYDSRSVIIARKAALYDRLMAAKPAVQQRVAEAPRMVRPGAAGAAPDRRRALTQQLKRSGSVDDAAALIALLG